MRNLAELHDNVAAANPYTDIPPGLAERIVRVAARYASFNRDNQGVGLICIGPRSLWYQSLSLVEPT